MGFFPIATSTIVVIAVATLALLLAALVRTWATSYLGSDVVYDKDLHSERVVADGPYRYVRNPLYLGTWLLTAAISILMPPGGALFALVTVTLLIVAWVMAEERKLTIERGDAYTAYLKKVPRFFPRSRRGFPQAQRDLIGCRDSLVKFICGEWRLPT